MYQFCPLKHLCKCIKCNFPTQTQARWRNGYWWLQFLTCSPEHSCLRGVMLSRARRSVSAYCLWTTHGHNTINKPHYMLFQKNPDGSICKWINTIELTKAESLRSRRIESDRPEGDRRTAGNVCLCSLKHQREVMGRQPWLVWLGDTHADQPNWGTGRTELVYQKVQTKTNQPKPA